MRTSYFTSTLRKVGTKIMKSNSSKQSLSKIINGIARFVTEPHAGVLSITVFGLCIRLDFSFLLTLVVVIITSLIEERIWSWVKLKPGITDTNTEWNYYE